MKILKVFLLTIIAVFTMSGIVPKGKEKKPPTGIYQTYEDYLNNNLKIIGYYKNRWYLKPNFYVSYRDTATGEKIKYNLSETNFWAFVDEDGEVYRVVDGKPWVIITSGELVAYGNFLTRIDRKKGKITFTLSQSQKGLRFSKGANGKLMELGGSELKKYFKDDEETLSMIEEMGIMGNGELIQFIMKYNQKHSKEDDDE